MKILLAAPQDNTVLGVISRHCKITLEELGCEVLAFDFRQRPYSNNKAVSVIKSFVRSIFPALPSPYDVPQIKNSTDKKINEILLENVDSFRPGLVLVFCGENIFAKTINEISRSGIITANWFHDSLIYKARQELVCNNLPAYDYLFIVDSLEILKHIGIEFKNVYSLALGCFPALHRRLELSLPDVEKYGSDIAFIGTISSEREKILEALSDFNLKIWGDWKEKAGKLKKCYQKKYIYGEEVVKVYNASKIILDIHSLYYKENEIFNVTPRVFEVPACGAFLLTNDIPQLNSFYKIGEEIVVYKNADDLKRLVSYYLEHSDERKKIATAAFNKVHEAHTYRHRLQKLLDVVKK